MIFADGMSISIVNVARPTKTKKDCDQEMQMCFEVKLMRLNTTME
jgi:hypothetical protein